MDSQLENSIAYYHRRLAETENKPELHQHLRLLYQKYLSLLEEYPDQLSRFALNVFPVIKAEKCDRHRAYMNLYRRFENEEGEEAHRKILDSLKSVTSFRELKTLSLKESLLQKDDQDARRKVLFTLCCRLTNYCRAIPSEKSKIQISIKEIWMRFKELDPIISWQRIAEHRPYRFCLYYDDERLELLGQTLSEALK